MINLVFGFASAGTIDNAAHLGGLAAGLWLGAALRPTKVATMSAGWSIPGRPSGTGIAAVASVAGDRPVANPTASGTARLLTPLALAVVVVVLVAGIAIGTADRRADPGRQTAVEMAEAATYRVPKTT